MRKGLLLFAHGARDPAWAGPFEAVLDRARRHGASMQPALEVRLAFLEFMQPGLLDAGASLAQAGCEQVDIVPLFLGAGGHVRKDLPALVDALVQRHPQLQWRLRPAVGEMPQLVDALAAAALAWLDEAASATEHDQPRR